MLKELKQEANLTTTYNGAITNKSSLDKVLDYFAQGSALRNRSKEGIISLFEKSYNVDSLLTLKTLFYSRDIRGGQGERKTFRTLINYMAIEHTEVMAKNIYLIPEYGRWDDMYAFINTPLEHMAFEVIGRQLLEDLSTTTPSLLGKWLKSENTSSFESRSLGTLTRKKLGLSSKDYRKMLTELRQRIGIVETKISNSDYSNIDYSKLPSKAGMKYRYAFFRNDFEHYSEFLDKLIAGETTINTATLLPYELIREVMDCDREDSKQRKLLDSLWNHLPNYVSEDNTNAIVVADTSGSMYKTPIHIALSLALYFAERSKGPYASHFITFSSKPVLQEIVGTDLYNKISNMAKADWEMNTNIHAVFQLILNAAQKNNLSQDKLPKKVIIVSDMEFDSCTLDESDNSSLFTIIKNEYEVAGYKLPQLVFWNVNSLQDNMPMKVDEAGVLYVSGASPSIFKALLKGEDMSPIKLMLEVLNNERYERITI